MSTVIRHGGESHVVRPDRVYRTSVIVPFANYQPQADMQAVARAFTTGGPLAMQLSGFGASAPGPIQRLILRARAAFAARRARKFMFGQVGQAGDGQGSPGPEMIVSSQVAPQMQAQMNLLSHLTRDQNMAHIQGAVEQAAYTLASRRPFTYYRAG